MLSQHSRSQALVKEEGCDRRGEPTLNLAILMEMKPERDKIILVKLVVGDMVLNVISAYALQIGLDESAKKQFWEDLDGLIGAVPSSEKLCIGGDLNGHIGTTSAGFEAVHGSFGYGSRNQEGRKF